MAKKDYLQEKYEEINQLKNKLLEYPKSQSENIIKAMEKIFDEIERYLKKHMREQNKKRLVTTKIFTIEELAKYNGKNGASAYVAIGGVVYDVSKIFTWKEGSHYGVMAGQDLTEYFHNCHSNNKSILKNAIIVGFIKQDKVDEMVKELTVQELAKYDGRNGRKAYVAVDGVVYDVTGMKEWEDGKHYGIRAGKDVTEYFKYCHKNEEKILNKLKKVGTISN